MEKRPDHIIVPLSPKAYVFGAESGVKYEVRLPSGDWRPHSPTGEKQYTATYDTMSCTTYSALSSLEKQANWLYATGKLPVAIAALCKTLGYIDQNGKFNFNDWFTAVMSGTRTNGNDFMSVWDSIRDHGVLPQGDGYVPSNFNSLAEWLDPTRVTTAQKEKALRFKEIFEVLYEFILLGTANPDLLEFHLKHAPIHIATPCCDGWNSGATVQKCDLPVQHATCQNFAQSKVSLGTYDTYDPLQKTLAWDYPVAWAVKAVLNVKAVKPPSDKPVYTFTQNLQRNSTGKEVEMWQRALKFYGFYKLDYFTQFFGYWTEQAVRDFQAAYAKDILAPIGLSLPTGRVASMTIKKMNALLKS